MQNIEVFFDFRSFSIANITFQARDQSNVQSLTNGPVTTVSAEDNIYFMENPSRGKCVIFNHCVSQYCFLVRFPLDLVWA